MRFSNTGSVLIDSNVLVIAHTEGHRLRDQARTLVQSAIDRELRAVIAHQNLLEWYSAVTHPKSLPSPLQPTEARRVMARYAESLDLLVPTERSLLFFEHILDKIPLRRGGGIFDLYLVATMLSHGIDTILTENVRDFARIPGITALNPFAD